jgi:hypothetical protein
MSRIRMKVFVRNESDATLSFVGDELVHGDFLSPGLITGGGFHPGA